MKKTLFLLLILFPVLLVTSLYYLDKQYFLSPIEYKGDMVIRCDSHGEGVFGSPRSGNRIHEGLDLFAKVGTPVLAARSGVVTKATGNKGMGNFVVIHHPQGIVTIYGHLSKIYVRANSFVRQGQAIGAVGKTGNANYQNILPHLHFEVRKNNIPQDPLDYLQ